MGFQKSVYTPKNKEKYKGISIPVCRSSWERSFCKYLDTSTNVVAWNSEPFFIPYTDRSNNKRRRYYPDFFIKLKDGRKIVVEIKPHHETKPPLKEGKKKKTFITQKLKYINNISKWKDATDWCKKKGYEFKILTEKDCGFK